MDVPALTLTALSAFGAYHAAKLLLTRKPAPSHPAPNAPSLLAHPDRFPMQVDPPVTSVGRNDLPSQPTLEAARAQIRSTRREAIARNSAVAEIEAHKF
jgi:hypothetical protein